MVQEARQSGIIFDCLSMKSNQKLCTCPSMFGATQPLSCDFPKQSKHKVVNMSSQTVAILTEFDGTGYAGFQRQKNALAVQQVLEDALSELLEQPILIHGCSRTDAGVHAMGHVSHFIMQHSIPVERLPLALRHLLPPDVIVKQAACVPDTFHAQFDCCRKRYRYSFWHAPHPSALRQRYMAHVPQTLDFNLMNQACDILVGTHNFRAYMAVGGTSKTTVRTLYRVEIQRDGLAAHVFVEGNGFLYNMVRIIVGTLIYVGQGKLTLDDVRKSLIVGDRKAVGKTMPPHGLCLEAVWYANGLFEDAIDLRGTHDLE